MPRLNTVLPNDLAAPGKIRQSLTAFLASVNLSQLTDDVLLLATELVTNAVRHARGPINVCAYVRDGVLRLEVGDASAEVGPARRRASSQDDGGRGIELVERLSSRWGWDVVGATKVVWVELPTRLTQRGAPAPEDSADGDSADGDSAIAYAVGPDGRGTGSVGEGGDEPADEPHIQPHPELQPHPEPNAPE